MAGTRNAYDSLERLCVDFEKDLRRVRGVIASHVHTETRDYFDPLFGDLLDDFRDNAKALRADLDLLHVEGTT